MTETTNEPREIYGQPAPSNHFHLEMNWTLKDITRLFPTGKFNTITWTGRNKEIMRGE
jgi:hypothetical protein